MVALALLASAGCATAPQVPTAADLAGGPGEVLVVAAPAIPVLDLDPLRGQRAQAAAGAGFDALAECITELFGKSTCSGAICGAAVIVGIGFCGGASLAAAGADVAIAPGRPEIDRAVSAFREAVDAGAVQAALRDEVALNIERHGEEFLARAPTAAVADLHRGGDLRMLRAAVIGAVLETQLTRVEFVRGTHSAEFQLQVKARARVLATEDGARLFEGDFVHIGERLPVPQWSARGGQRLLDALARAYAVLGAQIFDSALRLHPFPDSAMQSAGPLSAAFGLAPVYPLTRGQLSGERLVGPAFEWSEVGSLRPELRWQAYPRDADRRVAPADMARVANVRYDVIIARENEGLPGELVYRRDGIPAPAHRIDGELQPGARYFWSVRATFDLDGRRRVTPWASVLAPGAAIPTVPHADLYRFRTPR